MADLTNADELERLFASCDRNKSGFIERGEFDAICIGMEFEPTEMSDIFLDLDKDGDGRLCKEEFISGFREVYTDAQRVRRESCSVSGDVPGTGDRKNIRTAGETMTKSLALANLLNAADMDFYLLDPNSQEQVCDFYQQLHSSEEPQLVQRFEDILLSVIKDIRQQQYENDRLEKSFKREKESHTRHLQQLEEELEVQMQKVESRVRQEEREKLESEKEDLKNQLETEINQLQSNLMKLQEITVASTPENDKTKARLEEMLMENRHLKSSLTDAHTNLALVKSEVANIRTEYQSKCGELESEKDTLSEFIREQDSLTRQIYLMHDANKKLHDTNDDLTHALDSTFRNHTPVQTRPYPGGGSRPSSAGALRHVAPDYVSEYLSTPESRPRSANSSLAEELGMMHDSPHPTRLHLLPAQESCEVDSLPDDFDSGHSTLRDLHDMDSEFDLHPGLGDDSPFSPIARKRNRVLHGPISIDLESMAESELQALDDIDGEEMSEFDHELDLVRPPSRAASTCSKSSSRASVKSAGAGSGISAGNGQYRRQGSFRRSGRRRRHSPSPQKLITAEPERMYKVVLCGDAAVGKSSFILRLCKDKFVSNLNSTLGVDFHTKTLEVDGRIIALQLWDTAGQERFRSIAKSYFRRADGVLLLYDVTYERSFINVRDWVEAVEDGAESNVPIMLVGNKTDLRDEYETERAKRCVRTEDGQRLAREFAGLFIETSAKDGENILEAVTELSRLLRTNEDIEIKNVGMKLSTDNKQSSCCSV